MTQTTEKFINYWLINRSISFYLYDCQTDVWQWYKKVTNIRLGTIDNKIFKKIDYVIQKWDEEEYSSILFCITDWNKYVAEDKSNYLPAIEEYLYKDKIIELVDKINSYQTQDLYKHFIQDNQVWCTCVWDPLECVCSFDKQWYEFLLETVLPHIQKLHKEYLESLDPQDEIDFPKLEN